jgi:nicotinamidase-related amidase
MAKRLHGAAPAARHRCALLLIDFINDLEFSSSEAMLPQALAAARATARLKRRATRAGVPVIYVNDNFGRWQSSFEQVVAYCRREGAPGREVTSLLKPRKQDYFVLKPRHSAFYQTPLALLLEDLGAKRLILSGVLTDSCVLFSANDAYLRGFRLFVPDDCVAAREAAHTAQALDYMRRSLKADTRESTHVVF